MDKIQNMSIFIKVVEMGSFTSVANHLDMSVGNVSRAISSLEEDLDTRLLQRSTRRLVVTDAGTQFYKRCVSILGDLAHAEAEARNVSIEPRGALRIHAAPGIGRKLITRAVLAYRATYPAVSVDMLLSQRMPNLLEEQLDLAIAIARSLPDSGYVSQKIGASQCVLAASPAYLEKNPAPERPEDLADHSCVLLTTVDYERDVWQLQSATEDAIFRPSGPRFSVNDMDAMRAALQDGAGVGLLAGFSAIDDFRDGNLVRVLPGFHTPERDVYAIYPSRQFVDAKIKTFIEILKSQVGLQLSAMAKELGIEEGIAKRRENTKAGAN